MRNKVEAHGVDLIYVSLRDALAREGCPICRLGREAAERYVFYFLHENITSLETRKRFIAARGFCHLHARTVADTERGKYGDLLGTATVYHDLLHYMVDEVQRIAGRKRPTHWAFLGQRRARHGHRRPQREACPICSVAAETEDHFAGFLVAYLDRPELREVFNRSDGLCYEHLLLSLAKAGPDAAQALNEKFISEARKVIDLLDEYQRKREYRFAGEPKGPEELGPDLAIRLAAGNH